MDKLQEIREDAEYKSAYSQLARNCLYLLSELENKETELKLSQEGWAMIHDELRAELDTVKQENERLKEIIRATGTTFDCEKVVTERDALQQRLKQAEEALEWYADAKNNEWSVDSFDEVKHSKVMQDEGERARNTLSLIHGEVGKGDNPT